MAVDMAAFEALLTDDVWTVADEAAVYLADPTRTAHPLVSATTAELVAQALGHVPSPQAEPAPVALPGGLWRVLPDRLLALHPARRTERLDWLRISAPEHLELTALVLEQWGWGQTQTRWTAKRSLAGRRCIVGAQYALYRLGYGTEHTATEAGRQIQGALAGRGITMPYPEWNEMPGVTGPMVLGLVRAAVKGAS